MLDRRLRDAALLLPLGCTLLFLPPYISVFDQDVAVFGVPLLHVYLFGVWLGAIVLTAALSRRLARSMEEPSPDAAPDDAGTEPHSDEG